MAMLRILKNSNLISLICNDSKFVAKNNHVRNIFLAPQLQLKQSIFLISVQEVANNKEIIIHGEYVKSGREPYLLHQSHDSSKCCPICSLGIDIKHTDVLILSQFVRSDGCMLPRRITGLCRVQQKRMSNLVTMAQKAGLMSNLTPPNSNKDPKKRYGHKRFNKYYDESTIPYKL